MIRKTSGGADVETFFTMDTEIPATTWEKAAAEGFRGQIGKALV